AGERAQEAATKVADKVEDAIDIAVPLGDKDDPAARERERFNEDWRSLESLRDARAGQPQGPPPPEVKVTFVQNVKESFENLDPNAINNAPVSVPLKGDVSGPSVLKTQVYLDRNNFSVGALDGRWGRNTAIALWWFQRARGINAAEPGALDEATFRALAAGAGGVPALVQHTISEDDVKGPFETIPEDIYDKAKLDCLCYESKLEKLAERFHSEQEFLKKLNPEVDFSELKAGDRIWAPNVRPALEQDRPDIARVVVSIRGNTFNAFDAQGNLVFHAPTTLGSKYDPSPRETTEVKKITFDPWFHYQPTLFHEVPDDEPEANLQPGPNSPVGVVWVALSKPHFGIHGTSDPESIGYASSHGCVRLTNWDAREVAHRLRPGVQVEFMDTRGGQATASLSTSAVMPGSFTLPSSVRDSDSGSTIVPAT
ncbi:MAG: L,D-transpeptidase family protein, partial [Thermoanaerobaculia bacterium]